MTRMAPDGKGMMLSLVPATGWFKIPIPVIASFPRLAMEMERIARHHISRWILL